VIILQKEFSLSNDKVMINFTIKFCDTQEKLLNSEGFSRVLKSFLTKIKRKNTQVYQYLFNSLNCADIDSLSEKSICVFKLLTTFKPEEISHINDEFKIFLSDNALFNDFLEDFYSYWRKLERYTIICSNSKITEGFEKTNFIDANMEFSKLVRSLYRKLSDNVLGYEPNVYRQLPAGGNAGIILNNIVWDYGEGDNYKFLKDVQFIKSVLLDPPFITYPKKNTRNGFFEEVFENPLKNKSIRPGHWFCYPAKVGSLLAFIFFHRDFMSHGISLCNLFEMARKEEYVGKKPDIIYTYGLKDESDDIRTVFYDDKENDIMVGYVNYNEEIDYFGYIKKMTLTLHNLIMIKRGYLPIHGAMVNITLKNGKKSNIVILGDSGAGKSETIEAFRKLGDNYISDMTIVFDDMGIIAEHENGDIKAYGTETGAFVRLDDLDPGYAFNEIDRSIFMNPNKINSRLVIPITSYKDIMKGHKVDMLFYANNYEDTSETKGEIEYFSNASEAIEVFRSGKRMAKGTTQEKGLVESYFANPFGPYQKQDETDLLLEQYFSTFFNKGIVVGQIRTCLGITGKEKSGPSSVALKLFELIK
jgi:hypothetical protein